jgi:hypothetical protein
MTSTLQSVSTYYWSDKFTHLLCKQSDLFEQLQHYCRRGQNFEKKVLKYFSACESFLDEEPGEFDLHDDILHTIESVATEIKVDAAAKLLANPSKTHLDGLRLIVNDRSLVNYFLSLNPHDRSRWLNNIALLGKERFERVKKGVSNDLLKSLSYEILSDLLTYNNWLFVLETATKQTFSQGLAYIELVAFLKPILGCLLAIEKLSAYKLNLLLGFLKTLSQTMLAITDKLDDIAKFVAEEDCVLETKYQQYLDYLMRLIGKYPWDSIQDTVTRERKYSYVKHFPRTNSSSSDLHAHLVYICSKRTLAEAPKLISHQHQRAYTLNLRVIREHFHITKKYPIPEKFQAYLKEHGISCKGDRFLERCLGLIGILYPAIKWSIAKDAITQHPMGVHQGAIRFIYDNFQEFFQLTNANLSWLAIQLVMEEVLEKEAPKDLLLETKNYVFIATGLNHGIFDTARTEVDFDIISFLRKISLNKIIGRMRAMSEKVTFVKMIKPQYYITNASGKAVSYSDKGCIHLLKKSTLVQFEKI